GAKKKAAKSKSSASEAKAKKAPEARRSQAGARKSQSNGAARPSSAGSSAGPASSSGYVPPAPQSSAEVAAQMRDRLSAPGEDEGDMPRRARPSQKDAKLQSLFETGKSKGFLTFD